MPLTKSEVREKIKFKKIDGVWGITIPGPDEFVSASIKLVITRKDSYTKCEQDIKDSIKFADNSSNELGIKVEKAGDMDPDYENKIGFQTVFDDEYDTNGVALVDFDIGNVSTNYNSGDAPSRTETDVLSINENKTFYKFTTLEGQTDGGNVIDYQDYLKNGSTSHWDSRELPDISSNGQILDFHDNDTSNSSDINARMTFTNKDVKFNEKASLMEIKVQKSGGEMRGQTLSNDSRTEITRGLRPSKKTFYQIDLDIRSGDVASLTSTDRDGNDFYESKKAILIRDNCNGDGDGSTDYKNTLIEIKKIDEIQVQGPPPEDDGDEDPDPVPVDDTPTPDPEVNPVYTYTTTGGPCPTDPPWTWPDGTTRPSNFVPTCANEPENDTSEEQKGGLILERDPSNKKKVVLSFSSISGQTVGRELREQLNITNTTPGRSLANKLITLKITYRKEASWANSLTMTASCSDIKKPNGTLQSGTPYSMPSVSEVHAEDSADVNNQVYYFYNIDGSSTMDFVFSSTPKTAPSRLRYDGQTETPSETVTDNSDPLAPQITVTTTIACTGGTTEYYTSWPPCDDEAYVTKSGGFTASAVYSDGASDGANDQYITIELVAIRESATDIYALDLDWEKGYGIAQKIKSNVWLTTSTSASADNLGGVNGLSLLDYDEHSYKIRFRNPVTRTSAINLATDGTSILELEDHSGAHLPGTIDTAISNANSLPINLSKS